MSAFEIRVLSYYRMIKLNFNGENGQLDTPPFFTNSSYMATKLTCSTSSPSLSEPNSISLVRLVHALKLAVIYSSAGAHCWQRESAEQKIKIAKY